MPKGSKPPLFLVHPAGGTVLCYIKLAQSLGLDQPCYGLQACGIEGEQEPYACVEDMATHYIQALRLLQPHGPYQLAGWSLGGIVAFEMAQQLCRQGEEIALLALLDTEAPASSSEVDPSNLDDDAVIARMIGEQNLPMGYAAFQQLDRNEQLNYLIELARKVNFLPPDAGELQLRRLVQVWKANILAMESYVPELYPNWITLFSTEKSIEDAGVSGTVLHIPDHDRTLGWGRLSAQPVTVYTVPGTHQTLISEPHVQILAEQLRSCLDIVRS